MKERKGKNQKWRSTRKDYRMYHFTGKETAKYLLEGAAVCAAADYLFSEPSCVAVYASNTSAFSENAEEKMHCTAAEGAELPVPGCSDGHECGGTGRLFRGECGACQCKGSGETL